MREFRGKACRIAGILLGSLIVLGSESVVMADEVAEYIEEGRAYLDNEEYRAAEIQLKNALQLDPASAEARFLLGLTQLRRFDGPSAVKELEYARRLNHDRQDWLIPLARAYLLTGEFDTLMETIDVEPTDPDALQSEVLALRGTAQISLGNRIEARDSFMRALALDSENYDGLLGVARLALAESDFDEARRIVTRLVDQGPERIEGWVVKGELDRMNNDHAAALAAFEKALEVQPGNIIALLGRAEAALVQGDAESARADVVRVLEVRPEHPGANFLDARLLLQDNDLEAADLALRRVIRAAPNHMPSFLLLGALHYNQNNLAQAESHLLRFVGAHPEHLPARKLLAATKMKLQSPDQAIETLRVALDGAGQTDDPQLLALLGSAYLQSGEYDLGNRYLQQAAEIAPDISAIRTQLALSHLASGATDQAVTELESAVDLGQGLLQADVLLVLAHLRNNNQAQAVQAAAELVEKLPDNAMPHNLLGLARMAEGSVEEAQQAFEKALEIQPSFTTAWVNLARLHTQQNDLSAAEGAYNSILQQDPDNLEALLGLAGLAERRGDGSQQLTLLEKAWESHPESLQTGMLLVRKYLENQESREALNMVRTLRIQFPDDPTVARSMGLALLANDRPRDALSQFQEILDEQADSPELWQLIASAHTQLDEHDDAIQALDRALALREDFVPALVGKVQVYARAGRPERALETARVLQNLDESASVGHKLEGDVLAQQKDFTAAAGAYQQAYDIASSGQLALLASNARRQAGDHEAAATALRNWLAVQPDDHRVRLQLAMYLDQTGRQEDAIAEYEQLLDQQPDNVVALNNLAWLYHVVGDERAVARAERAVELAPDRPEITDTLGWILVEEGEVQRGLLLLQQAAVQAPHIPDIRYHLAVAYQRVGRLEEARKELQGLLSSGEQFARRADAEALMNQLAQ